MDAFLLSRALLQFHENSADLHGNLSAVAITPDGSMWLGSDELPTVERLSPVAPNVFGEHQAFRLGDFVHLYDPEGEVDIEGMDYDDHYLWFTGSHSLKRGKAKGKRERKDIAKIATVQPEPNRFLLARIPVIGNTLFTSCSHPEQPSRMLTAATLQQKGDTNALMDALREDEHLGPLLALPLGDKENGFNIEGLAAHGNRVFLGLRGPVLDGWAIIISFEVAEHAPGVLSLASSPDAQRPYKKHFLDLDGLGVREIQRHGNDLLILAGPTMHVEGIMKLFRFKNALSHADDSLSSSDSDELELIFVLPFTLGADHAEGLALLPCLNQPDALLIVYDAPHPARVVKPGALFADIFRLP